MRQPLVESGGLRRIVTRERIRASADPDSANEKGGVVRRPFSKLQAWLIAVSPNRESLSLSARRRGVLSLSEGTERGAAKPPLLRPRQAPPLEEPLFTPH